MPVLRTQASRAGLDVKAPTHEALRRFVDRLADVERSTKATGTVAAIHPRRLHWVPKP